ncbi:DUF2304 domain-containing protein [Aeromicrobium camelliae]|uniref:DUF2304 domain-containing protein n=1 Tax=Aeromicrobium camelliae TaxID=1538144 RepID=A0A3N6WVC5_9ACTN|nr:DUF2304 domain-containing protein [Aeromicrobium camelliae]RQN08952.1 DUF2304 domain-containing protein [Aeromicrobium camelliae]
MIFVITAMTVLFIAAVVLMLLRRQLQEKYAVLWIVVGVAMLVLEVSPPLLGWLASVAGVQVPSNLLFFLGITLLLGVSLHLSWELSRAEDEIRRVAEEVTLLRAEMERITPDVAPTDADDV